MDLDGGWKHFYSGDDPSMSAQAGVRILTSPHLSDCVSVWIPLESLVCMLKLKVLDRSLCLLQVQGRFVYEDCGTAAPTNNFVFSAIGIATKN